MQVVCPEAKKQAGAEGLPPADGPPVDKTLTFPEGGGTQTVLLANSTVCTITETLPAACTLVSINPPTVDVTEDDVEAGRVLPVTVINNCEVAAAPAAIAAAPTFTG